MTNYDDITDVEFDAILETLISQMSAGALLQIPGAYEVFSEHLNNEVLEIWENSQ